MPLDPEAFEFSARCVPRAVARFRAALFRRGYQAIVKAMEDMAPTRERWYAEFLDRIQTRGFNVDGDMRVKIQHEDIPLHPVRQHRGSRTQKRSEE